MSQDASLHLEPQLLLLLLFSRVVVVGIGLVKVG